jgi:hypothetical protein
MTASEKLKTLELHGHMIYINGIDTEIHDEFIALVQAAEVVSDRGGEGNQQLTKALEVIAAKLWDRP